ncbi:MFS transporter [Novosphingobium terrae]|uniref:MFS transporter n=1 Tax=Novosphingobium terrae TaxID=2726189 RepID=UPI001F136BEC|nr:MFS transporter [Novosphingobium terrae]
MSTLAAPSGGLFRSLRNGNYRLWTMGAFVSNIGTWVQRTAQDWLVLTMLTHHSASAVGIVMALQFGPQMLLLPWTGVAADRFDQRRLLMVTQAISGALALGLGVLTLTGLVSLWQVYVFAFLFGCASAFDAPVRQTFVGQLVGDADLPNAVALNSTSFNSARMIGPAVAGLIIAAAGIGWSFVINGISFFAVMLAMLAMNRKELRNPPRSRRGTGGFVEGLRYVRARPDLIAILAMLFLIGTFGLNFPIFISTMAVGVFHADARAYGLLSSMMAVGTVTGALFNAQQDKPRFKMLIASSALFGLGCTLAALAPSYWWFGAALLVTGIASLTFTNATNSLMQISTEPAMRGRVMALRVGIALGGTPLGAPVVGFVADHAGPRWALGVAAAAGVASVLVGWRALKWIAPGARG